MVREAIARFHPEQAAGGRAGRQGRLGREDPHPGVGEWAGTSWLDATADSVDLTKFGDLITDIARRLGEAGDSDTPGAAAGQGAQDRRRRARRRRPATT